MGQAAATCCTGPEGPFTADVRAVSVSGLREPTEPAGGRGWHGPMGWMERMSQPTRCVPRPPPSPPKVKLEAALGVQKESTPTATYQVPGRTCEIVALRRRFHPLSQTHIGPQWCVFVLPVILLFFHENIPIFFACTTVRQHSASNGKPRW